MKTNEGGTQYEHSLNHALEFFSKAGSQFKKRANFYSNAESMLSLFQKSWIVDEELTMKILLYMRDCRGGAGNRSGTRDCYAWLAANKPEWLAANIGWLPLVGRWDDLKSLFGTNAEKYAVELWAEALKERDVLAAKWADRSDVQLRKYLGMTIGDFRRFLAKIRKEHIVEHKMCSGQWNEINYEHIPSVAMARYTRAFGKNDEERFMKYKESLKKGEAKVHANVLFPHDCVRTVHSGDSEIANAQFNALPNYIEDTDEKIICISDTSGSMNTIIGGIIRAMDVSQALALYCSAKMSEKSPFYKKFIGFCSEGRFKDWNGMTFSEAISNRSVFDRAAGGTRIDKALMLLLETAKFFKLPQELMPTMLLILSDMQFHSGVEGKGAEVEKCMTIWNESGYETPKIVYWNLAAYPGSPDTAFNENIALISGFSPSILKAILTAKDFSPLGIMMEALKKYDIVKP